MFTGIVEEVGKVKFIKKNKNLFVLGVSAKKVLRGIKKGDSIAVNGVCLTVTNKANSSMSFDVMKETIDATALKNLAPHAEVNLERSLKSNARVDGHFVTGHVDFTGTVKRVTNKPNYTEVWVQVPTKFSKYFAPKGSTCVDGVSLTIGEVKKNSFSFYLIPYTKKITTFGSIASGDSVNVETDILAKYILNARK